jgi:hypothetical protein
MDEACAGHGRQDIHTNIWVGKPEVGKRFYILWIEE